MAIEITDEMVQAARRKMPARWSMQDLHDAIAAAIEAGMPPMRYLAPSEHAFDDSTEEGRAEIQRMLAEAANGPIMFLSDSITIPAPGPIALGGVSEIADRFGVARSTVNGWIKRAEKIGMPPPLAILAAGPVYNLVALDPWYVEWKNSADADSAASQP